MKRPERYPYTRSQWVEETADFTHMKTTFITQGIF